MNILKSKTANKLTKNLTVLAALIFNLALILLSSKTSSLTPTQDCSAVSGTALAGNNCLYFYPLPLCRDIPGKTWTIDSTSILTAGATRNPRTNCADLSDLPLCNQLTDNGVTAYSGKNCVKECSDSSFSGGAGVRGSDYAVHNRDCVRFCDAPETGLTAIPEVNCTTRKCHQVATGVVPDPSVNCSSFACNKLTTDELNETKFSNETTKEYRYCDSSLKCYEFSQAQLPYLITNKTCKIHNCRVPCVDNASDDVSIITNKGTSYVNAYKNYVNAGMDIGGSSDVICIPKICKPIVNVSYACGGSNDPANEPNSQCTCINCPCSEVEGTSCVCQNNVTCTYKSGIAKWLSTCSNGYCPKVVDCNDAANSGSSFCMTSEEEVIGSTNDTGINSWFYRPIPHDMATNGSGALVSFNHNDSFSYDSVCYSISQMDSLGWGKNECFPTFFFGCINLGYFHDIFQSARSPKKCNAPNLGIRGNGYGYLCGVQLNFTAKNPNDNSGYQYGYVETTFSNTDGTNLETVCLRFDAGGAVGKSCGKRECQITCAFAYESIGGCTQICGSDVCVDLKVKDSDPYQCMMNNDLFNDPSGKNLTGKSSTSRDCAAIIDRYIRVRAVKYGEHICNFIDFMGDTAYSGKYFNGSEKISFVNDFGETSTYCASGTYDKETGNCLGGKNTNLDKTTANKWRTVKMIPYIKNNQPSGKPKGYLDIDGRLFPEQNCIKTAHRITVPRLYNLANSSNSPRLFIPPLFIQTASIKRDGSISPAAQGQDLGETDFHYPEINISFGPTSKKLSLGFGKTGYESADNADPLGSATISTTLTGGTDIYELEVMVRKEYDETSDRPTFCLYKKVKDQNGVYLNPERVGCVNRKYPEIDNTSTRLPSDDFRKLIINADPSNTYSDGKIVFKYLSGPTVTSSCGSDGSLCTNPLTLANLDTSVPTCTSSTDSIENHKICVERDPCNKLNNECIKNEIDLYNAYLTNQETSSYIAVQNNCNQVLLPSCNSKFGINTPANATITNTNPSSEIIDPEAYGWFDEICITSGFSTKIDRVYAYLTSTGVTGKCVIDYVNKKPGANCSSGGKKPDCPCLKYIEGTSITGTYDRDETAREAGLCIDLPLPQLCPAINHNPYPNSNVSDPNYVATSLGFSSYGTSLTQSASVVNLSHRIRSVGLNGSFNGSTITGGVSNSFSISGIPEAGHADFPQQIFGVNKIAGTCSGFWQNAVVNGVSTAPTSNCLFVSGQAVWDVVTNPCVRYSCPAISTSGVDSNGNYQGNYTNVTDPADQKGLSHGFATWPQLTKTNDFVESASALTCVTGYKKVGATATLINGETNADHAALYNNISRYTGGTTPTRLCDQVGNWGSITNPCQRITCSAINLDSGGNVSNIPTSSADSKKWELWRNSGGASFPAAKAALSSTLVDNTPVKTASTSTGTCNNSLGFYQIGSTPPTRVCNHLGNWEAVQNQCVTRCDEITCISYPSNCNGNQSSHGFATWNEVQGVAISGEKDGEFKSCTGNKKLSAYPPLYNKYGVAYTLVDSGANYTTTIPRDVSKDNRIGNVLVSVTGGSYLGYKPERSCKSTVTVGGQANVWTGTSTSCVETCPSYTEDPRTNAGVTIHPVSSNVVGSVSNQITVNWPSTNFGSWAYSNSPSNITSHDGSHYFDGRTNGYYSLARYCNPVTRKWDTPFPTCATNSGEIKVGPGGSQSALAKYSSPIRIAVAGSAIPSGSTDPALSSGNGTCLSGSYSNLSGSTTASSVTCAYKDTNNRIDEVYIKTEGVKKCNPYCYSTLNQTYGSGSIDGTSSSSGSYYSVGTTLNLNCKSNYGSAIIGGSNTAFNDCGKSAYGLTTSDRSSNRPYVLCNSSGSSAASWSSIVNDCSACRNCSGDADANGFILSWSKSNVYSYTLVEIYRCTTSVECSLNCAGNVDHYNSATCTDSSSCTTRSASNGSRRSYSSSASCTVQCTDGYFRFTAASCSGSC